MSLGKCIALFGYVATVTLVVWWMFSIKRAAVEMESHPAETADEWQDWRDEAIRQEQGEGPVRRRAPQIDRPPMLLIFGDYFGTTLVAALALVTVFYGVIALAIRAMFTPTLVHADDP